MMHIVRANPADWNDLKDELLEVEHGIFGKMAFGEGEFAAFKNPKAYNLLVYSGQKIVGYLMSQRLSDNPDIHRGMKYRDRIFYLESIGILSKYHKQGIGSRLFSMFIVHGRTIRCTEWLLETNVKGMIAMAELYGFRKERWNKLQLWDGKGWTGCWVMRRVEV